MRIRYHGSVVSEHGLGYVIDYRENPSYYGRWTLIMDTGHTLMYARRESFTILEDEDDSISTDTSASLVGGGSV